MSNPQEEAARAYEQVQKTPENHKGHLSHQLIAGAAGHLAMKAYIDHEEKNGKHVDHATIKKMLAGFAAGFVDHLVETKGLDAIDRHKAKKEAEQEAQKIYDAQNEVSKA